MLYLSNQVSLAFRISQQNKDTINNLLQDIQKEKHLKKGESLMYVINEYQNTLIADKVIPDEYIEPNVRQTLNDIQCEYLIFEESDFKCLEKMENLKKAITIKGTPEQVLKRCKACIKSKLEKQHQKILDERRKESIKKLERFMKGFMDIFRTT